MSTAALVVVVTVALLTVVALAVVVLSLVRRLKDLAARVSEVQKKLEPELELLARETEIAGERLSRLTESSERVSSRGGDAPVHFNGRDG